MKTALAIVCSLLLIGTLFVPASAPAAGGACARRSCCGSEAACCTAKTPPEPLPVSAAPAPSLQNQLLAPAFGVAWLLPEVQAGWSAASGPSLLHTDCAPLFARHCARLN